MDFFELIRWGEIIDVKQMVEADPSLLTIRDPKGYPPLILASYSEQYDITQYFLEQGADVNAQVLPANKHRRGVCLKA